jgi:uncharacterized protein (TIGR00251 family)
LAVNADTPCEREILPEPWGKRVIYFRPFKINCLAEREGHMELTERGGGVTFAVRVVTRASRDAIEGVYGEGLKVRLTAPPVENKANDALRRLLAERLNVPVSAVRIVAGEKSRAKQISVAGITRARVIERLGL